MDVTKLFGRRVRGVRKARGLTQEELGGRAEVSYKYIGAVERGEENPSLAVIVKIAVGLGVEPRDLFDFAHEETSPAKLRSQIDHLLKQASVESLQQAARLVRSILR